MVEYLIRRTDGEWFDLHTSAFANVLRPNTVASRTIAGWGDHRIEIQGVEISFSYEDPGIQVSIDGNLPEATSRRIVEEILSNVEKATGQKGRIVEL